MTLFGTWLAETDQLQKDSFNNDLAGMDPEARAAEFRTQAFSAVTELVEMSNEIGWKPWATSRHLNRASFISEGVDVLHFVANLLLLAGCTDEELETAYVSKMDKNRQRQIDGYDGVSSKCPQCKRDLSDAGVACTPELCAKQRCLTCGHPVVPHPYRHPIAVFADRRQQ